MGLKKKDWLIFGGGLGFVAILAVSFSLAFPAYWPYEMTGLLSTGILLSCFVFLPKVFKDASTKGLNNKAFSKVFAFFTTKENQTRFLYRCAAIILFLLFVFRFECGFDYLGIVTKLVSDFMAPWQVAISAIMVCLWTAALLFIVLAQFFRSEMMIGIEKWVGGFLFLVMAVSFPLEINGVCGNVALNGFNYRGLLMGVEFGIGAALLIKDWILFPSVRVNRSLAYGIVVALALMLMTSIWDYLPQNLFGTFVQNISSPIEFSVTHRLIIGLCFVVPVVDFLLLYPFDLAHKRAFLIFVSLNILFSYLSWSGGSEARYLIYTHLYTLPLHLCNTAMYIMPICLVFMWIGLFYFTMFINVLGAFLAIMMPNYGNTLSILDPRIFQFFNNHIYAFMMPVLIILLGVFNRPKWKYFGYSMIGFVVYFALVSSLNTYFNATIDINGVATARHPTDFFFIGSDYVASKVADHGGKWAENLFDFNTRWVGSDGYTYTIRIPYLVSYFLVYVLLALGMWYLYEILFSGVDSLIMLHERRQTYQASQLQFQKLEQQRRNDMPNKENEGIDHSPRLTISHFTKRYGTAKTNAVTDFSLDIGGGKIYGFLGKNGAGKSTIIKAVVGMHGFNSGSISVCGYDIEHQPVQAKEEIGFVPDNYALYETLTGRQYINYMADIYGVTNEERSERLPKLLQRLEMGSHFDDQMKTYSHGMKQKITIIGALIHNPKIWILDEPMTGVDPNSIFEIKECMREHAKNGNIVFFSSHLIDVIKNLCDEIIIIKHGKLIMTSSMEELKKHDVDLETLFLEKTADTEEEAKVLLNEEEASSSIAEKK